MPWPRGDRLPQAGRRRRGHFLEALGASRVGHTHAKGRPPACDAASRRILHTVGVPAIAVSICQICGSADERALVGHNTLTTMPPCSCGGQMQVSRIFYDRRITHETSRDGREASDALAGFGS